MSFAETERQSSRAIGWTAALVLLTAGCAVTTNGMTVDERTRASLKRIAVVSLVGDTLQYRNFGFASTERDQLPIAEWNLDTVYAKSISTALSGAFGVDVVVPVVDRSRLLKVYDPNAVLRASRRDWGAIAPYVAEVARASDAQLVALVLADDQVAGGPSMEVSGLAVYRQLRGAMVGEPCRLRAALMITMLDTSGRPVAGATVYEQGTDRASTRMLDSPLPNVFCERTRADWSEQQREALRRAFSIGVPPAMAADTARRLLGTPR